MFSPDPFDSIERRFEQIFGRRGEHHDVNLQGVVVRTSHGEHTLSHACIDELMRNPDQLIRPHIIKKHLMCDFKVAIEVNTRLNYS